MGVAVESPFLTCLWREDVLACWGGQGSRSRCSLIKKIIFVLMYSFYLASLYLSYVCIKLRIYIYIYMCVCVCVCAHVCVWFELYVQYSRFSSFLRITASVVNYKLLIKRNFNLALQRFVTLVFVGHFWHCLNRKWNILKTFFIFISNWLWKTRFYLVVDVINIHRFAYYRNTELLNLMCQSKRDNGKPELFKYTWFYR